MKMKGLLKAAKKGNTFAQCQIGNLYFRGIGVEQDFQEALEWYRNAAMKGDGSSQLRLGLMYANGIGVEQDLDEAMFWIKKAYYSGHPAAQLCLGSLNGASSSMSTFIESLSN